MSQTNARVVGGGLLLPVGATISAPNSGEYVLSLASDGSAILTLPNGSTQTLGGSSNVDAYGLNRAKLYIPTANLVKATLFDAGGALRTSFSAGGLITGASTVAGGGLTVDTSGTANSVATVWPAALGTPSSAWTPNQRTGTYYVRVRAKFNSAGDAVTINSVGLTNVTGGAGQIRMGINGAISAANFTYNITDGAGASSHGGSLGVAIETASFHTFEMWNVAGAMQFAIDEGAAIPVTNSAGSTDPGAWLINAVNGATAASRSVTVSSIVTACVAP